MPNRAFSSTDYNSNEETPSTSTFLRTAHWTPESLEQSGLHGVTSKATGLEEDIDLDALLNGNE